jgi:cytochrome c556
MKTMRFALLALAASGLILLAEEDTVYTGWMKTVGSSSAALRKMETKTGPEAVTEAEKLAGVYEELIGYWRQRNAADAVKAAQEGKAAAVAMASAANAGDAEKVASAMATLAGTCKTCHAAHREQTGEGKYKIK